MHRDGQSGRGLVLNAGLTVLAFGLAPFFKKAAIETGVAPWPLALGTVCVAAVFTLLVALRHHAPVGRCLFDRRAMLPLAVIGIVATGLVTLLVSYALSSTTATNRSLFQAAYPAATLLFAHMMLAERLHKLQYAGVSLIMVGLLLANGSHGPVRFGPGFWLLALTLPLIGFSDALAKRLTRRFTPLTLAAGRNLYGAAFVLLTAPLIDLGVWPSVLGWLWIVAAGLCQGLGVWSMYRALDGNKASLVASLVATAPLVTVVLEMSLLELSLDTVQWLGIALVVLSAALLVRSDHQQMQTGTAGTGRNDRL